MHISSVEQQKRWMKLAILAHVQGHARVEDLLKAAIAESISPVMLLEAAIKDTMCPAICTNDGCEYTSNIEPDEDRGHCRACDTNTMVSALVLAGII